MADSGDSHPTVVVAMPAMYLIGGEEHMKLLDVLRMLLVGNITEREAHKLLTNFENLAPLCHEKWWGSDVGFNTSMILVHERKVETWDDFSKLRDDNIEDLYINAGWARRMIEAHRRKGVKVRAEYRPMNRLFGKSPWVARVITADPNVFFYM